MFAPSTTDVHDLDHRCSPVPRLPRGTGGELIAGVYYATGVTYYFPADAGVEAGPSGDTFRETVVIAARSPIWTSQAVGSMNGTPAETSNFQASLSGARLYVTQTCANAGLAVAPFSVTGSGSTITVYMPQQGGRNGPYIEGKTLTLQTPADAGAPPDASSPD
jgi:hypothetical protein